MRADKLLGGYAAGNLTAEERRLLMEAALKDQALFDALADEEALRELLQDPAARDRLLEVLNSRSPKVVPFFRRPWVMGAAATVLLGMSATALYFREPAARLQPKALQEQLQRLEQTPAEAAPPASAQPKAPARGLLEPKKEKIALPASLPEPAPVAAPVPAAPAPVPPPPSLGDAAERQQPLPRLMKEEAKPSSRSRTTAPAGAVAAGSGGGTAGWTIGLAPAWAVDPLPEGRVRVRMHWQGPGHPVLLLRHQGTTTAIPGAIQTEGNAHSATFLAAPGPGAVLDLYLLPGPPADPASLPAAGPLEGWRQRIFPVK